MHQPPQLTDRPQLLRQRERARRDQPALFLHDAVADEMQERLTEVNRRFTNPAIVTAFPEAWHAFPNARFVADEEVLDLEEGAHDLLIHDLALHWSADPVGQLVQARRALRPDGLFLGALFAGQTLSELRAALAEAEVALTGGLSPRVAPMGEIRDLGGLLYRAGLALPVADGVKLTVTYGDLMALFRDLRAMAETNALAARRKTMPPRMLFPTAAEIYGRTYALPDGRLPATFEIVYLTGWAPDASQQQPLRPGTAIQRLEDALNAPRDKGTN
ncbi:MULTISPECIES: SAM-dependent methyltransferase [unclassified Haematobacter]|uniref:SAM-dependent methyltransferase n=1 Tax=unclassified Haematobacter TaxID=2640585 RepID=UPI0025BF6FAD|nr:MULTISPECIES: SAM-dependent methyltransferase [unclassified Haematobacter]